MADLTTELLDLRLKSPVIAASGTFGYGDDLAGRWSLDGWGALVVKSLTAEPREGNPPPRIAETPAGMLNSIGLQNIGVERFVSERLPALGKIGVPVIVNVAGRNMEEYVFVCRRLKEAEGIAAIEINISCPNVKAGGIEFGRDAEAAREITGKAKEAWGGQLIVKLSPNVTDICAIAKAAERGGADAITVANTFLGMAIDVREKRPLLNNIFGGLSGPAIRPLALRCVWEAVGAVQIPVIGNGGIASGRDAAEFLLAGARAVAVGTANFLDPESGANICRELAEYMDEEGFKNMKDIIGAARRQ